MFENLSRKTKDAIKIGVVAAAGIVGAPPAVDAIKANSQTNAEESRRQATEVIEYYKVNPPFFDEKGVEIDMGEDNELVKKMKAKGFSGSVSVLTSIKKFGNSLTDNGAAIYNNDKKMTVRIGFRKPDIFTQYPYPNNFANDKERDLEYAQYALGLQKEISIEVDWEVKDNRREFAKVVKEAILRELDNN